MATRSSHGIVLYICVLLLALANVNVGRETGAANPATPVICQGQATSCTNQTLFTPANCDLPDGTYIATSLPGARELADYLDTHPNATVAHLLISDASIDDLVTDFGYEDDFIDDWDPQYDFALAREKMKYTQAHNRNISRNLIQTVLDLDAVSARIMDRVAPSLESLSYLNYIRLWDESYYYDRRADVPDNRTRTVLDRDFPCLTHLTLRDHHWRFQDLPGRRTFFRALPALTHLHVVSNFFPPLSTVRASVPNATHIRFSGNLPAEFSARRMFLVQWARSLVNVLRRSPNSPLIIAQPPFTPMLNRGMECGNPGIAHTCLLGRLARNRDIHLNLPIEYDYDEYGVSYDASRTFSLRRAIAEFEDRLIGGGEGEWAVPSRNDTLDYAKMTLNFCA
ncbi:hypothetical protein FB451DRAFT_1217134 [Mycena latifolia]|nr:hypothetical protein FB451DRAFT_1217134 [Mycena latifolia]